MSYPPPPRGEYERCTERRNSGHDKSIPVSVRISQGSGRGGSVYSRTGGHGGGGERRVGVGTAQRDRWPPTVRSQRDSYYDRSSVGGGRSRGREREPPRHRTPSEDLSSGSPVHRERMRPSWFDVTPEMVVQGLGGRSEDQVKDIIFSTAGQGAPALGKGGLQLQQATRHARRIYVGGLPPSANEERISSFFSYALAAVGGNTGGVGNAVVNVYINFEKKFAFVELRTVEEASNAMALDGIMFEGVAVRIRRPNDYNPAHAARLGPSNPSPSLNLAAVNLTAGGMDAEDRIFVGGLPYHFDESHCRQLLEPFGKLQSFELVRDREKGESKGYGFAVFIDKAVTESAIVGLNGLNIEGRVLTCRKATEGHSTAIFGLTAAQAGAMGVQPPGAGPVTSTSGATRILVLVGCATREELSVDKDYDEIKEDMTDEAMKHGRCMNVVIPRPAADGCDDEHVGKVVIEFEDANVAMRARNALHGRKFGGHEVEAFFLPEHLYSQGHYSLPV